MPEAKAEKLTLAPELTRSVNTLSREMTGIFCDYRTLGVTERLNKHANENAANAAVLSSKNGKYALSVAEDHLVGILQIPGAGEHKIDFTRDILEAAGTTGKIDSRHATHLRFLYNSISEEMNFLSRQFQNDPESIDRNYFNALSSSIDAMHELFFASGDLGLTNLVLENSPRLNELRISVLRGEKPEDDAMANLAVEASLVSAAESTTVSQMNDRLTTMREQLEEKQAEMERMRAENIAGKLRESNLFQQSELHRRAADELRQQMSALKMDLTNANLDLASEREQRANLQVQLAQLEKRFTELTGAKGAKAEQKKIEPKLATPKPKAPSSETAARFKAFADTLFVKRSETTKPPERKAQLSKLSRGDTLANFETEAKVNLSNRYGLYAFLNEYFGATLNIFKAGNAATGETFLENQQTEAVQAFARAVETLGSDGKAVESLRQTFLSDFVFGHEYIGSGYSTTSDTLMIPALASMSPEEIEKTRGLYLHIEGINEALNQTIQAIEKTSGTASDNPYINEMATNLRKLSRGKLFTELKQISTKIGKSAKDRPDWKKENLVEVKIENVTASSNIIEAFQKHQEDAKLLHHTLIQLGVTIDFAQLYASMPKGQKTANFLWQPNTSGEISIANARNPYSVFASIMFKGKRLADLTEDDLYYAKLTKRSTTTWKYYYPPTIHSDSLPKALANETPISFAISAGKPIAVFVGNNGAGKTHAMETFIQSLGIAHTAGVNYFAGQVDSPQLAEIRSLIGASSHDPKLSSFQREGTLLKSALETLSDKDGNEVAVFAVDEVGKGTDSRDAIALMIAASEYCRRNNIRLVMATHHGKQFMEIAGQLGLTPEIEIYAPEFETHELRKHEAVVDSFGIEVMEKRAKELGIPPAILATIIGNAKRTREAINRGQSVSLEEVTIPKVDNQTTLPFVDIDSLRDIGMYAKSRSKRENVSNGLTPIHKLLWEGRYPSYGRDTYYWETAEEKWADRFLTDMSMVVDAGKQERHATITSLVDAISEDETRKRVNQWATTSAHLAAGLFDTVDLDQDNMRSLIVKIEKLANNEDSIESATWMSLGYQDEERLTSFNRLIANPTARSQHFRAMEQLSEVLGECSDSTLQIIAAKLRTTLSMESQLAETINQTGSDKETIFRQAIFKHAAKELDENAYYFDTKDEAKLQEIAGVNSALEYTKLIRDHIVPAIRTGNQRMFSKMQEWLSSDEMKNRYSSIKEIRSAFNIAIEGAEQTGKTAATLIHRGKSFSDRARAVNSSFQYIDEKEIGVELARQVKNGDYKLLIEVLDFISENDGSESSYTSGGYLQAFNKALNYRRWINWQKQRKQMLTTRIDVDHYQILGATPADSFDDIRAKYRVIQKQCHPDLLRTRTDLGAAEKTALEEKGKAANDAWGVLGDKDNRSAYDQALSENAIQDLAFYLTTANAVHELGMTKPEFSRDGSFRVKNALAINLLNYLSKEQIIPQSLEFGGDTDVVVIGGINGGGKSQLLIQMASIMQWARATGYVPAESAVIPELKFFASAVNAGESTEAKSSFQNEIDRYNDLLKRYVEAGCPQDGIIFLDEPLAGTSSEDQQAILISLIDFFRQRNVKVILTNHNYKFYESMRRTTTSDDDAISFIPVAYLEDSEDTRFKLQYYGSDNTDEIRSDGIRVAGQMGVPQEIIDLAYFVRKQMTGTLET